MIYLHGRPYGLRQHVVPDELADRLVTFLTVATVDGRAYPLFAALYGYGLARIFDRTLHRATPDAAHRLLRRRSLILILFGLLHAVAGFSGDVLGWYGLLGIVLAGFLRDSDRTAAAGGGGRPARHLAAAGRGVLRARDQAGAQLSVVVRDRGSGGGPAAGGWSSGR